MKLINKLIDIGSQIEFSLSIAENYGERELKYVNPVFCQTTGYEYHECIGKNCRFLQVEGQTNPEHPRMIKYALENNHGIFIELLNETKDKEPFINRLILLPFTDFKTKSQLVLGLQNKIESSDLSKHQYLNLEEIKLNTSDMKHYLNNILTILSADYEDPQIALEKNLTLISRIRDFVLNIENENKFPSVY